MADNNLNSDSIRDFLAGNGGKARNSDVVLHFKEYLNYPDPKKKEYYRQRFKECINQVAVKKDENGTKFIVLRKKFREKESVDSDSSPRQRRIGHPHQYEQGPLEKSLNQSITESRWREQIEQREEEKRQADNLRQAAKRERERRLETERKAAAKREEQELRRIQEENMRQQEERLKEKQFVDERTQEEASVDMNDSLDNSYTGPSGQTDVLRSKEGERIIEEKTQISSVTDQVQKIDSSFDEDTTPQKRNSGLQRISEGNSGSDSTLNKDTLSSSESQASIRSTVLNDKERLWIMYSAQNELAKLSLLLSENKDLSHSKDFINGWTAMHWGAKHGRKEMIRLVANTGLDINTRSHAGYTPLHIAAMYNRELVMQFLTQEYQADVNIRDYSGKRPHQYLANTEQMYLQHYFKDPSTGVLPNIKIGHLEKLEAQEKRSSKFGSLRASFRALRTWGSTESIPKKRTISTGSILHTSPKMRPKSLHVEHHRTFTPESSPKTKHRPLSTIETDRQLMPPPAVPSNMKKAKNSFAGNQPGDFHKSGSDSNISASSTSTYI